MPDHEASNRQNKYFANPKKENAMCEANAYIITSDEQEPELIMNAVDTIEPTADGLKLTSIFGDQKFLDARIHSLSLVDHKVYLKK